MSSGNKWAPLLGSGLFTVVAAASPIGLVQSGTRGTLFGSGLAIFDAPDDFRFAAGGDSSETNGAFNSESCLSELGAVFEESDETLPCAPVTLRRIGLR